MPTLSDLQAEGVRKIARWYATRDKPFFYLAGFAGTGKSTILPDIIEECGLTPSQVAFCAPTGKAAKVMMQKFKAQGWDVTATTIHKLIYRKPGEAAERIRQELKAAEDEVAAHSASIIRETALGNDVSALRELLALAEKRESVAAAKLKKAIQDRKSGLTFEYNEESMVRTRRLVVVDEASMVSEEIARDLLSFGIPVLAIGDPGQLPPVSDKPGFTQHTPDHFLTEIHRQAADNPIIWLSAEIRAGRRPGHGEYGGLVKIISRRNDNVTTDLTRDLQVICGTHKTRWALTSKIRRALGYVGPEKNAPQENEPVIITRNSRQHPALVNGSIVYCTESVPGLTPGEEFFPMRFQDEDGVDYALSILQAPFEEHEFQKLHAATIPDKQLWDARKKYQHADFGWVLTCHKSQGSQWDEVVVHDESRSFRDESDRWLYTAVTRAAERLTVVSG